MMKKLALAFALALAVLGGAVAVSAITSANVAAYTTPNC
jgi:hypothetical protein